MMMDGPAQMIIITIITITISMMKIDDNNDDDEGRTSPGERQEEGEGPNDG